ncbi:Uncharacterised protein [Actinobaculum suis]|uniref:Replicative helicase inhibitor G39P N-terminal domain-containing protein n=1 Tax=Actinobaculum suis TaxID=1657 RepID=A0A7Z8YAG7_9ACTO|nr:hypothetical protein [Actinobaculum suis]VDG77331.1 Uncharacterised protein [Actinobaculum suis]
MGVSTELAATILAYAAAVDNRQVSREAILAWASALPDWLTADLARAAIDEHRRTSTEYLQPAHIVSLARTYRDEERRAREREEFRAGRRLIEQAPGRRGCPPEIKARMEDLFASLQTETK